MRWWTVLSLSVVACTATSVGVAAEPVTVVRNNGPDENRVNVVILGDGYTREELAKYTNDAELLLATMFLDQPFADYSSYFNVRRVDVTSNESGADHPADGVYRDTALGGHYDCADIARLICVDDRAVLDVLDRSVPVTARDVVLLLEPISKSFKQYQQGCELHKAQEVVRIVLPARHNTALPLEPGKKALDLPPPRVAT